MQILGSMVTPNHRLDKQSSKYELGNMSWLLAEGLFLWLDQWHVVSMDSFRSRWIEAKPTWKCQGLGSTPSDGPGQVDIAIE